MALSDGASVSCMGSVHENVAHISGLSDGLTIVARIVPANRRPRSDQGSGSIGSGMLEESGRPGVPARSGGVISAGAGGGPECRKSLYDCHTTPTDAQQREMPST